MTIEILTIGVYGWTPEAFFAALQDAGADTFCDVRARRGVRGAEYAFANSRRLQARLDEMGVRYLHHPDLAPSDELRKQQHAVDDAHGGKRKRAELIPEFVEGYQRERLADFDSRAFIESLPADARRVVLFCVEREPAACHRGLLAARLAHDLDVPPVRHLTP